MVICHQLITLKFKVLFFDWLALKEYIPIRKAETMLTYFEISDLSDEIIFTRFFPVTTLSLAFSWFGWIARPLVMQSPV